jgi:tol-pal system protein YbgF
MRYLVLIFILSFSWSAYGQSTQELNNKYQQLRRDLDDVQRYIYSGKVPKISANGQVQAHNNSANNGIQVPNLFANNVAPNSGSNQAIANMQIKITSLTEENQKLRGMIEELSYQLNQLQEQFERNQQDQDFRFKQLEKNAQSQQNATQPASNGIIGVTASNPNNITENAPNVEYREHYDPEAQILGKLPNNQNNAQDNSNQLAATSNLLPEGTVQERYDYALNYVHQGDYNQAQQSLKAFINAHENEPLAGNAAYWLAESYYAQKDYVSATDEFVKAYQNYPNSNKRNHALYKLALSLEQRDLLELSCQTLQSHRDEFGESDIRIATLVRQKSNQLSCPE